MIYQENALTDAWQLKVTYYLKNIKAEKKENNLLTLVIKMYILFARAITTSTARASSVFPLSYRPF